MAAVVVWQANSISTGTETRLVDRGAGVTPRLTVETQAGTAAMGEPIWIAYSKFDLNLIAEIALALGVIK